MRKIIKLESALLEQKTLTMRKRIGSTVYEVNVHFCQEAKETMGEKILRLIKDDLYLSSNCVKMVLPKTVNRLPERSSIWTTSKTAE